MLKKITIIFILFITVLNTAFGQHTLKIAYQVEPPFVVKAKDGTLSGSSVWLWENIAKENNLKFEYVELPLESILHELSENKVDASLSPLTITSERFKTINFTIPYHTEHASLLERNTSSFQKSIQFLKSFFSINFLRAVGALMFIIFVFGLLIWSFERKKNKDEFHSGIKGVWEGFWWSAVTMTTVGYGDKSPRTVGGRIISLIWMFTAIIIISGFTAGIASSLTVNNISSSNNKIEDFRHKTLGTIEGSATDTWLKNNFFTQKKEFKTLDEALLSLTNKKIDALAYDRASLQSIIKSDTLSKYQLIDVKYNPQFYAFGLSKKLPSQLVESINYSMLSNIEKTDWKILLSESGLQ